MTEDCADAIVVGAGPAGAIAARVLASAGARVCLIDRSTFPRHKLCGDTLNPGARTILRRLGLDEAVTPHAIELEGMLVSGEHVAIDARYPEGIRGLSMSRQVLDDLLVAAAVDKGVDFRPGVTVRGPLMSASARGGRIVTGVECVRPGHPPSELRAPVVIAADGRRSTIAFALKLARHPASPRRWAIGAQAIDVAGLSELGEMHIRQHHYIGIAPLPGGAATVCVVKPSGAGDRSLGHPHRVILDTLASEPMLRDRVSRTRLVTEPMVLGPLAVDSVPHRTPPRGLILAGDAAGFIDPMTGDGVRFALRGGELAAHAALRVLAHGWDDVHADLEAIRRREFGLKWRFNRMIRGLVATPAGVRGAAIGGRLLPAAVRALVRYAGDCGLARASGVM